MSDPNIVTGSTLGLGITNQNTMESWAGGILIFSASLTQYSKKYSNKVTVHPGKALMVDAFDIPEGYHIYVNRACFGTFPQPSAYCCQHQDLCDVTRAGELKDFMRMNIGYPGDWEFCNIPADGTNPAQLRNQMIITLPGDYLFELEDLAMLTSGSLLVVGNTWDLAKTPVPDHYLGGIDSWRRKASL